MILDIQTANPPAKFSQQDVLQVIEEQLKPSQSVLGLYQKFLSDDGIINRYVAADDIGVLLGESLDEKMKRFEHWAVELSVQAADKVLCDHARDEIRAVFIATCTGYLCPGLSTYVCQRLGLKEDTETVDLVGLGCAGAAPALRRAEDYLAAHPDVTVLVIAVEICTAAVHWTPRPDLILSNAIFADGAAAVLMSNKPGLRGLQVTKALSLVWPQFREELRFKYYQERLCNVISSKVPEIAAKAVKVLHENLNRPAATHFAFHSGGRKVLDTIQARLGLSDQELAPSREVLRNYGNMSSPSMLFALKNVLDRGLNAGSSVLCFTFGAGFTASLLHLDFTPA